MSSLQDLCDSIKQKMKRLDSPEIENVTKMASRYHGKPYNGESWDNDDIGATRMAVREHGKPFNQPTRDPSGGQPFVRPPRDPPTGVGIVQSYMCASEHGKPYKEPVIYSEMVTLMGVREHGRPFNEPYMKDLQAIADEEGKTLYEVIREQEDQMRNKKWTKVSGTEDKNENYQGVKLEIDRGDMFVSKNGKKIRERIHERDPFEEKRLEEHKKANPGIAEWGIAEWRRRSTTVNGRADTELSVKDEDEDEDSNKPKIVTSLNELKTQLKMKQLTQQAEKLPKNRR